jgi:hypothetical protein
MNFKQKIIIHVGISSILLYLYMKIIIFISHNILHYSYRLLNFLFIPSFYYSLGYCNLWSYVYVRVYKYTLSHVCAILTSSLITCQTHNPLKDHTNRWAIWLANDVIPPPWEKLQYYIRCINIPILIE